MFYEEKHLFRGAVSFEHLHFNMSASQIHFNTGAFTLRCVFAKITVYIVYTTSYPVIAFNLDLSLNPMAAPWMFKNW